MSATEAARFRFLSFLFLRRSASSQPARLLPGPSKEPGWESSGEKERNKVCVIKRLHRRSPPQGTLWYSRRQIWALNGLKISRDGAEFREFVRSAVDFLRLTTGEFSFSHSTQSALHTSCWSGNSSVTTNLFFWHRKHSDIFFLTEETLFLFVSWGDKNTAGTRSRSYS